jgi:hypothetical protein
MGETTTSAVAGRGLLPRRGSDCIDIYCDACGEISFAGTSLWVPKTATPRTRARGQGRGLQEAHTHWHVSRKLTLLVAVFPTHLRFDFFVAKATSFSVVVRARSAAASWLSAIVT